MNKTALPLTALFAAAATGCGGGFTTDLDPGRRVSTLSPYEAVGFCESAAEHISDAMGSEEWIQYLCTNYSAAEFLWSCDGSWSDCKSYCNEVAYECTGDSENYGKTFRDFADCAGIDDYDYEDCGATVEQVEACVDEYKAAVKKWKDEVSCNADQGQRPSKQLSAACLNLLDDYDCRALIFGD